MMIAGCVCARAGVVERAYVSTDRDVYIAGETIRCSAFCVDESEGGAFSSVSSLLYLELHSTDGLAQTAKIALVQGRGAGEVILPKSLPTGNYKLIAYTALNKSEEGYDYFAISKTVSVFNPFTSERVKDGVKVVDAEEYAKILKESKPETAGGVRLSAPASAERGSRLSVGISADAAATLSVSVRRVGDFAAPASGGIADFVRSARPASPYAPSAPIPEYEGEIIHARVMGIDPARMGELHGRFAFISAPGEKSDVYSAPISSDGEIDFFTNNIYGDKDLVCEIEGLSDDLQGHLEIVSPFVSPKSPDIPALTISDCLRKPLLDRSIGSQLESSFASDTLYDYLPYRENLLFGDRVVNYHLDDYTRFPLMEEVITEFIPELRARMTDGRRDIRVRLEDSYKVLNFAVGSSLMMLDGVPVFDHDRIYHYDPLLVEDINIYPLTHYIGERCYNGIVNFVTYGRNLPSMNFDENVRIVNFRGVSYPTAYTCRDISSNSNYPDYRSTLYWHPIVSVDASGSVEFDCFTPDYSGTFEISVEGLTSDGRPVSVTKIFEVN